MYKYIYLLIAQSITNALNLLYISIVFLYIHNFDEYFIDHAYFMPNHADEAVPYSTNIVISFIVFHCE